VLFRGGEEREARKYFIGHGYLDAIIGLPANLFYGTGIPACILMLNKDGAAKRDHVLFINADREYSEGKAQSFLRPSTVSSMLVAPAWMISAIAGGSRRPRSKQKITTATFVDMSTMLRRLSRMMCARICGAAFQRLRSTPLEKSITPKNPRFSERYRRRGTPPQNAP
jgi:hypothetical protein